MNPRERFLALILVVLLVVAGGGFGFVQLFWRPLENYRTRIAAENEELATKMVQLKQARDSLVQLQRYRQMSLPADPDRAKREYENFLNATLIKSGFVAGTFNVTPQGADNRASPVMSGKKPIYTKLAFTADGPARLENVVRFLEAFYRTPLLHQIRDLSITRSNTPNAPRPGQPGPAGPPAPGGAVAQKPNELQVHLKVEALIMAGADHRNYLLPAIDSEFLMRDTVAAMTGKPLDLGAALWAIGPTGPRGPGVLAQPPRNYHAILAKDIFFGPPPATAPIATDELDYTQVVQLTSITRSAGFAEAVLYQRFNNRNVRLRTTLDHSRYRLTDDKGQLVVQANVVKIMDRDIILQVDDRYYNMHVGDTLAQALEQPLTEKQAQELLNERVNAHLKEAGVKLPVKD